MILLILLFILILILVFIILSFNNKYKFDHKIYIGGIRQISDIDLNIGIEIETCSKNNIKTLRHFYKTNDLSISCKPLYFTEEQKYELHPIEYVLSHFISGNRLLENFEKFTNNFDVDYSSIKYPTLRDDIIEIQKETSIVRIDSGTKYVTPIMCDNIKIKDISNIYRNLYTCGLHFHVSSHQILFDNFGLVFLINLLLLWAQSYQEMFLNRFLYQKTIHSISYSKPLIISEDFISEFFAIKTRLITEELSDEEKIEILNNLRDEERPFLTVINDDTTFIHVEFRGLLPWNLDIQISDFYKRIKKNVY
jgi:hypothetical protein